MMSAIAIDDEPPALRVIEEFCKRVDVVRLERTFTKPKVAARYMKNYPVDLLFLDIQMPSISGLEFYTRLETKPLVIFTTAFSEYAVEGFNVQAMDYLLKPITFARFTQAIDKAYGFYQMSLAPDATPSANLFVRSEYSLVKIAFDDILFIEGQDDYVRIWLVGGKDVTTRMTLKSLNDKLPSRDFIRVHRSFIISVKHAASLRSKAISIAGKEIPVGRRYEQNVNKLFENRR